MNKKIQINFFCKSNHWSRRMIKIREIAARVIKIDDLNFKKNIFYVLNMDFLYQTSLVFFLLNFSSL